MSLELSEGLLRKAKSSPLPLLAATATVTVVITCFNYARFLEAAVASAMTQESVIVDVIIVDDASTDGSLQVAESLAKRWSAVTVIAHSTNRGTVESFNDGAAVASGEFLVRLDADDLLTPGSLARAVSVAQHFPTVGLVYGHPLHFSSAELPEPRTQPTRWTLWPGLEWLEDRCRQGRNVITSPEVLMRRSIVEIVGYQAPLKHSHDMEHWLRISAYSDVAYVHGADQAWHREHEGSLSAREVDSIVDIEQRILAFDALFFGKAGELPHAGRLHQQARWSLALTALTSAGHALDAGLSREDVFEPYMRHAVRAAAGIQNTPAFAQVQRRAQREGNRVWWRWGSLGRRLKFRVGNDLEWLRWHRSGVF